MEVGFADALIPEETRAELEDVLRGIAVEPPDYGGDRTGRWVEPVERITVLQRIPGGRSGADVLDVELERSAPGRVDRRVIKVDTFAKITKEWLAFRDHLAPSQRTLVIPIDAISRRVLDGADEVTLLPDRAAIVYYHAADYASTPGQSTETLEILARGAIKKTTDVNAVVAVLDSLLPRLTASLYTDRVTTKTKRTLRSFNSGLGPDIILEVDRAGGPHALKYQDPVPTSLGDMRRYQSDVLTASTIIDPDEASSRPIALGDTIFLKDLSAGRLVDGVLAAHLGDTTVTIQPAPHVNEDLSLANMCTRTNFDVIGKTVGLRAHDHWQRVERSWPSVTANRDGVGMHDVFVEHPFRLVHTLLTEDHAGRVISTTHGDLNPRNVLRVGDQVFLIDFARTQRAQPLLADFAWLELCLMRDVIAPELDWPELVLLQRTLAVASRLSGLIPDDMAAVEPLLGDNQVARAALAVLWTIRRHARKCYPSDGRRPWWRDYLTHLTLAGCRTLKWPDTEHDEPAARAVVSCCGVAAEWIDQPNPYRRWSSTDIVALIRNVAPLLRTEGAGVAEALAELVNAAERLPEQQTGIWNILETTRAAVTTSTYAADARQTLINLHDDHDLFISLDAYIPLEGHLSDPRLRTPFQDASIHPSPTTYGYGHPTVDHDADEGASEQADVMQLITGQARVVVLGGAGSGKSTVVRELQFQLASAVNNAAGDQEPVTGALRPLMPVLVRASDVVQAAKALGPDASPGEVLRKAAKVPVPDSMLSIGAVHVAVDAFNELTTDSKKIAAQWVRATGRDFRHTPVLVCHRTFEYEQKLLPFPTVVLLPVTTEQARRYIEDMVRINKADDAADRAATLCRMLLDNPEHQQVQDLAKTPLFLWMIVKRYVDTESLPSNIGALFDDFARWYMEERHHHRPDEQMPTRRFPYPVKVQVLETLGRYLVEHGNITEIDESDAIATLAAATPTIEDPDGVMTEIVASEMLHRSGSSFRFLHQSFQEYFAALVFAREADDTQLLRDRAMVFAWREPLRIMLGFSGDRPELTDRLIRFALRADARFAAKLLRASENPPHSAVATFVDAQRNTLTLWNAGEHDWEAAAQALAYHDTPDALAVLQQVATDGDHPLTARIIAFDALADGARHVEEGNRLEPASLTATVATLLADDTPAPLRAAAIRAVGKNRLMSLTLRIGDLVDDGQPWPVLSAAADALQLMGVELSGGRRNHYLHGCAARLLMIEDELKRSRILSEVTLFELEKERRLLLPHFTDPARLDILLPRRFSYGLATLTSWSHWLASPGGNTDDYPPELPHILFDDVETEELLSLFADPNTDDLLVAAAAHRLITGRPETDAALVSSLLQLVTANSSVTRLLAVATAVAHAGPTLPPGDLAAIDALIRNILDQFREELAEPLAALVQSLDPHRDKQIVLSGVACDWLNMNGFSHVAEWWPFHRAWATIHPTMEEYEFLLLGDEEERWVAISHMAGYAYVLDASKPFQITITESSKNAFKDIWRTPETIQFTNLANFFLACTSADICDFLDELTAFARNPPAAAKAPRSVFKQTYGTIEIVELAHMLGAIGYLGRVAFQNDQAEIAKRAYDYLREFDSTDQHHSVRRGKLVGLGYLGDWMPLLSALDIDDPLLPAAAANTVSMWVPGPFTPGGYSEPQQIAGWIATQLTRPDVSLTADHRSTLSAMKDQLETRLGRHIVL